MGFIKKTFWVFLFTVGFATDYTPWFTPLFEFQGQVSYFFERVPKVNTPSGNVDTSIHNSVLDVGVGVTPWPYWNVEAKVLFTHTENVPFGFEAAYGTLRYAWWDDLLGDPIAFVMGATISMPGKRFLRALSFPYHGDINFEFHATAGKEWSISPERFCHIWGMGGFGIANQGSPWLHAIVAIDSQISPYLGLGFFSEALYGLGKLNLHPNDFHGYALINHQNIDIGAFIELSFPYIATVTLLHWYNVHAHNFISRYWGLGLSLLIPFSII